MNKNNIYGAHLKKIVFKVKVSLCRCSCLGTCYVDEAVLKPTEICLSLLSTGIKDERHRVSRTEHFKNHVHSSVTTQNAVLKSTRAELSPETFLLYFRTSTAGHLAPVSFLPHSSYGVSSLVLSSYRCPLLKEGTDAGGEPLPRVLQVVRGRIRSLVQVD